MFAFGLGVASLAVLLGFLVGASSSPVAGVAVTAGFGLVAAGLAYMQSSAVGNTGMQPPAIKPTKAAEARALSIATMNSVGRALLLFSIAFASGIALGVWARTSRSAAHDPVNFPWAAASAPTSAREAVDWILVHRNLRKLGYTDAQVEELYRLAAVSRKADPFGGSSGLLLSPLFSQQKLDESVGNLIANNPPPLDPSLLNRPFSPSLRGVPG